MTQSPKEMAEAREWWIETHETLRANGKIYLKERRNSLWPQVYETDVVPNTIHVIEKAHADQREAELKALLDEAIRALEFYSSIEIPGGVSIKEVAVETLSNLKAKGAV